MKKSLLTAAAFAAFLTVPTVAQAQDSGWYLRGNVGAGVIESADFTGDLVGDVEGEANISPSVGLGYDFGNGWRLEADGTYHWNDLGAISQLPSTSADMHLYTAMLNAIYDFDDFGRWTPYVGAGVGFVRGKLSAQTHDFPSAPLGTPDAVNVVNPACSPICDFTDTDDGLAWQLIAGVGYDLTENLVWDTHYKYMGMTDLDYVGTRSFPNSTATSQIGTSFEDAGVHFLGTGFRYKFGAPAVVATPEAPSVYTCWDGSEVEFASQCPAQMVDCWDGSQAASASACPAQMQTCWDGSSIPVTDTCPVQTYQCWDGSVVTDINTCPPEVRPVSFCDSGDFPFVVYFEWDRSNLTDQAQAVIDQAATTAQTCGINGIVIEGHADSSGAASYNVGLSNRRATAVRRALVNRGFQAGNITTQAKGETELAVATGDGVREPLNRRTEVTIRLVPTNVQ